MTFTPTIPLAGIAGWRFLERTADRQQAAFEKDAQLKRDVAYFEEKIGGITSAADLVADRRLLKVALGAFGLDSEIDKKALVRRVLEEGTNETTDLALRMTEPAYRKLANAFGFGNTGGSQTATAGFAAKIVAAYKQRAFEGAVGEVSGDMRLALNFRREIGALAEGAGGSWYSILGSKPMRAVIEKAFGLPSSFGQLDVDKQADILKDKASAMFGSDSLTVFQDPAAVEKAIERFLARSQIENGSVATGPAAAALTLLRGMNGGSGTSGLMNLLVSKG